MTNKALSHFKESIHHTLKIEEKGGQFCVSEQEDTSTIKNIYFSKGNNDDFLIIGQNASCMAIKNLFEDKTILDSCDFIVLLCKKKLHIFFCEIKSSMSKENCQKAFKQMRSSKIFLEYLYQNYKEHFNSDFEMSVEEGEYVYIYPSDTIFADLKKPIKDENKIIINKQTLHLKQVSPDKKGCVQIINIYEFLEFSFSD